MAKKYHVINKTDTFLCIQGVKRIEIPKQSEVDIEFANDEFAKKIVNRIRLQYPSMQVKEVPLDTKKESSKSADKETKHKNAEPSNLVDSDKSEKK